MEPLTRRTLYKQSRQQAEQAFENHILKIADHEAGRFVVRRPENSFYWAEIVVISGGVLVHGDIATCVFKHYSGAKDDPDKLGPLRWMHDAGPGYAFEKYCIGMNVTRNKACDFEPRVALDDINDTLDRMDDEGYLEEGNERGQQRKEAWEEAREMVKKSCNPYEIQQHLWENDPYCDGEELDFGYVIPIAIFSAQAAMKTVLRLL